MSLISPIRAWVSGVTPKAVVSIALFAAACTPAALPGPTAAPTQPAKPAPAPAAPAAASPAAAPAAPAAKPAAAQSPVAAAPADWEKQWNDLVAAAQKEGKVVVYGPPTQAVRAQLPEAFKRRFGIELEYIGVSGSDAVTRLQSERSAGVYAADAALSGGDNIYRGMAAEGKVTDGVMGMLAPLRPALILPEVTDPTKYRAGKLIFDDPEEKYILRSTNFVELIGVTNTDIVPTSALTSLDDLLKPEYKGKIAAHDPSLPGYGLATASFLYVTKGEEWFKQLYLGQEVFLLREANQLGDLVARGSHPITIALVRSEIDRLHREGFKIAEMTGLPGYINGGFGMVGLFDKAPHPNAAKVFVNWIASKEGSQVFQDANRQLSARNDVDVSAFPEFGIPKPGVQYLDTYNWNFTLNERVAVQEKVRSLLGRR